MEGDEIRLGQKIIDTHRLPDAGFELPRTLDRDGWIEADDIHAEAQGGIGDAHADRAKADDTQRSVGQFETGKVFLPGLDILVDLRVLAFKRTREIPCLPDVARRHQHAGKHEFLDSVGIGTGSVEDRHSELRHLLDRDVIDACARTPDRLDGLRQLHVVHLCRAHEDSVRMRTLRGNFVISTRKPVESGDRNIVKGKNLVHGSLLSGMAPASPAMQVRRDARVHLSDCERQTPP